MTFFRVGIAIVELKIDNQDSDGDDDELPSISGGGLTNRYNFVQLHFHWGEGLLGSEHTIDRQKYGNYSHLLCLNIGATLMLV